MATARWQRLPQSALDVQTSNNSLKVVGILGIPIDTTGGTSATIPMFDKNGVQINLLSVLPVSVIPSIPFSLIINPNTEPQFNYRFQGGV